ncbi:MAG TPA: Crp/Fnr family transcriptional regulator [Actinomycetota bacterium]|nr:Crp/Fnr family transcriptional regulator [Actinomycetota bacterium]
MPDVTHRALIAAMSAVPVLAGIASKEIERLADTGLVHTFRRGTYLCHQGDPSPEVFFLVQGRVEISSISATGSRVLHASVDSPQFLGELGVLGDLPRSADLLTLDDSDVWSTPGEDFVEFVTAQPSASRQLLSALARQIQEHQAFADDLLYLDLKGRVAKRLLQMGTSSLDELPEPGTSVGTITHADLASLCGGSRENVTRVLTELQKRGLVKRDGQRYVLKKPAQLARIAGL